nr:MAG TPA: hypothetical protein [Caudoviricetes sp.]
MCLGCVFSIILISLLSTLSFCVTSVKSSFGPLSSILIVSFLGSLYSIRYILLST